MSAISLQITYRKGEPFAAYIYLGKPPGQKCARTEQLSPEVLIDYARDGSPIGIEIVSPGYVTQDEIHAAFDRLGIGRPPARELRPLIAA